MSDTSKPHVDQPVVEIMEEMSGAVGKGSATMFAPPLTRLRINGMDMGAFDGFHVDGADSDDEGLLRVTVTLLPSKLVLGIDGGAA